MNQGRFERPSPTALGRVVQSASTPTGLVDWANFDIAGAGDENHTVGHASVGEPGKRCTITTTAHSRSLLTAERTRQHDEGVVGYVDGRKVFECRRHAERTLGARYEDRPARAPARLTRQQPENTPCLLETASPRGCQVEWPPTGD